MLDFFSGLKNKWREGYELWIKMQNSDIIPSKNFINCFNVIMNNENNGNDNLDEFNKALSALDLTRANNILERYSNFLYFVLGIEDWRILTYFIHG